MIIGVRQRVLTPEQSYAYFSQMLDALEETIEDGRALPFLKSMDMIFQVANAIPGSDGHDIFYRAIDLQERVNDMQSAVDSGLELTIFDHPIFGKTYAPRADIFVPGRNGYSVVELEVHPDEGSFTWSSGVRDGGDISPEEVPQEATRVLNVTGGVLTGRGKDVSTPITGYNIEDTLAPVIAMKYLRMMEQK